MTATPQRKRRAQIAEIIKALKTYRADLLSAPLPREVEDLVRHVKSDTKLGSKS